MKKVQTIFEQGGHKWLMIARDPDRAGDLIDTNEYLVAAGGESLLMDPGGSEIFPAVFSALATEFNPAQITALFASHQDPDIISSLSLWLDFKPALKCYVSWLWAGFIPHFGGRGDTFVPIPDPGMVIPLGDLELQAVAAHYLHSSGNFHLYDPKARVYFSGDVGAALLPPDLDGFFVTDFDRHIAHARAFHQRWMGSAPAKRNWCERVSKLPVDLMCPQHGAIYQGRDVERFINWFDELEVGVTSPV